MTEFVVPLSVRKNTILKIHFISPRLVTIIKMNIMSELTNRNSHHLLDN